MSMMVSFVLSFFPRDVLDEILNLIESVSEDFPSYSFFTDCPVITYNTQPMVCSLSRQVNHEKKINNASVFVDYFCKSSACGTHEPGGVGNVA